jgi:hypothetical protein
MPSSWDELREGLFGMFYLVNEQKNRRAKRVNFTMEALRYMVLFLIDAGQVLRALVLPEYGWNPSVITFVQRMDITYLVFQMVRAP